MKAPTYYLKRKGYLFYQIGVFLIVSAPSIASIFLLLSLIGSHKNGNKSLAVGCQFCIHKFECYKDANKGKGLRVFQYSNKKVFLADVIKEPNVEDITKQFEDGIKTQTFAS